MTNTFDDAAIRSCRDAGFHTIPPTARQVRHELDSAILVRGTDRFGDFELEPEPARHFDPVSLERYRRTDEAKHAVYYQSAAAESS